MDGKKKAPKDVSAQVNAKAGAEVQSPTVADPKLNTNKSKSYADIMYPVKRGLRGALMDPA